MLAGFQSFLFLSSCSGELSKRKRRPKSPPLPLFHLKVSSGVYAIGDRGAEAAVVPRANGGHRVAFSFWWPDSVQ